MNTSSSAVPGVPTLSDFVAATPTPHQSFPDMEKMVLDFWATDNTFAESLANREGCDEWTFYDGPPFANGLPHYGHLLTGYAKDTFPRFQTMRGKRVDRVCGWDTHGLPAELEAMKQLGLTEKSDVLAMGVDAFNAQAEESVLRYVDEWKEYVTRQGRWVDFDGGYKTLDLGYMESVMWAFKTLHDKGLMYEGYRVLPYCWKDQTPLSTHELNMDDDVYLERTDTSATVAFAVDDTRLGSETVYFLAWTTTPWTLPMNLALAVNPDLEYAVVRSARDSRLYLMAGSLVEKHAATLGSSTVLTRYTGSALVGMRYAPLWSHYADTERYPTGEAWQVLSGDFVTAESGTGVVHLAPSHGEDDQKLCEANGVPAFLSVDDEARYLPAVNEFHGQHVFDAVPDVMADLDSRGLLFSAEQYSHNYPHCWRCGTPLVYKAVSSWFVKVTALRERMLELNGDVTWHPANVGSGVFYNWVANARDWSVSRNRFWGSPVPVWKSDNPEYPRTDVYGSLDEMERDFGVPVTNLHRPFVDDLVRPNPDDPTGKSMMRRVEDVLDVWFDSGAMPFAQMHYPFENTELFEEHHPSDFVVEYVGQTRGWFYVMHALSTALFDRPAFRNAVAHGVVLGNDGLKMSKKTKNYPDVNEVFESAGSDAMRWFLMTSPVLRGGTLAVSDKAVRDGVREAMLPLWNAYCFYRLYVKEATWRTEYSHVLDRYLMARTGEMVQKVGDSLERFDAAQAGHEVVAYLEMLNNWYVRRSRSRLWDEDRDASDALYTALETLARAVAPLLPMMSEVVWKGLGVTSGAGVGRSVHLSDYPESGDYPFDDRLLTSMESVRKLTGAGLSARKKAGVRVRQPLASMAVRFDEDESAAWFADDNDDAGELLALVRDEMNVKSVVVETSGEQAETSDSQATLKLVAALVGKRFGKDAQAVFVGAREGDWKMVGGTVVVAGQYELQDGEYELVASTVVSSKGTAGFDGGTVVLDLALTRELEGEGFVRDMLRVMQDARKNAGLDVSDRVEMNVLFSDERDHELFLVGMSFVDVASEVLATEFAVSLVGAGAREWQYVEEVEAGAYTNEGGAAVLLRRSAVGGDEES